MGVDKLTTLIFSTTVRDSGSGNFHAYVLLIVVYVDDTDQGHYQHLHTRVFHVTSAYSDSSRAAHLNPEKLQDEGSCPGFGWVRSSGMGELPNLLGTYAGEVNRGIRLDALWWKNVGATVCVCAKILRIPSVNSKLVFERCIYQLPNGSSEQSTMHERLQEVAQKPRTDSTRQRKPPKLSSREVQVLLQKKLATVRASPATWRYLAEVKYCPRCWRVLPRNAVDARMKTHNDNIRGPQNALALCCPRCEECFVTLKLATLDESVRQCRRCVIVLGSNHSFGNLKSRPNGPRHTRHLLQNVFVKPRSAIKEGNDTDTTETQFVLYAALQRPMAHFSFAVSILRSTFRR
jgi:hypothetical protein